MNAVKDKIWFLREGLFAKYVVALVGLVVFVLAVNGAMEIWISYRGIKGRWSTPWREGGSHRPADRAVDVRAGAAHQLGDARQRHCDRAAHAATPRRLCATVQSGCRR